MINLKRVMNDITAITITYLIICMAFSLGLIFLLKHAYNAPFLPTNFNGNNFRNPGNKIREL